MIILNERLASPGADHAGAVHYSSTVLPGFLTSPSPRSSSSGVCGAATGAGAPHLSNAHIAGGLDQAARPSEELPPAPVDHGAVAAAPEYSDRATCTTAAVAMVMTRMRTSAVSMANPDSKRRSGRGAGRSGRGAGRRSERGAGRRSGRGAGRRSERGDLPAMDLTVRSGLLLAWTAQTAPGCRGRPR
jgi:hypothetical protein